MKAFAHHYENGNVCALVTASGSKVAMVRPEAGQFVTQIDSVEIDPRNMDIAAIRKMAKDMKIPVPRFSGSKGK